jgi:GNAT superfamily N-acetyltransferase
MKGDKHMPIAIRPAVPEDAIPINELVIATLRASNAKDYSPEVIERVERSVSPQKVTVLIAARDVFVASTKDAVIGTASLEGPAARTVFVHPRFQRQGVGQVLMRAVEAKALARGVIVLLVPASTTSERFYAKLGYQTLREQFDGDERTLMMQRDLGKAS